MGFGEAFLFLLFTTENWPDPLAMAVQSVPGLAVAGATALGIRWPRLGGALLAVMGVGLALWWALRHNPGWQAFLVMPGGLLLAGVLLWVGRSPLGTPR